MKLKKRKSYVAKFYLNINISKKNIVEYYYAMIYTKEV